MISSLTYIQLIVIPETPYQTKLYSPLILQTVFFITNSIVIFKSNRFYEASFYALRIAAT